MNRNTEQLDKTLERMFQERGLPGISVSIRGPEGILYQQGFGMRNIQSGLPVDNDTMFGIASMSKSMTALCCAILHVEGRMSLDDPMVKYFPDLHVPGVPDACVTVRAMAMHRAGLPPMEPLEWSIAMNSVERDSEWYREMLRTAPNKMDKIEQIVDYITQGKYETLGMPGEYMSYSNEGYALLSYVVDQAAGIPLEQFLQERIFGPLGMDRTILDEDCSGARVLSGGNITSLFEREEDGTLVQDDNWSVLPPFRGCACVKSTAENLTRYYKMLSDGGMWEGRQVIPAEAVELLVGREFPLRRTPFYCLGLEKRLIGGRMMCEHSGGLHGVSTRGGFLEGGYSAAVLCNEGDVDMEDFQWVCYNYILGIPLDTKHHWARPSGGTFDMPEAVCGDYLIHEGLPSHCIIRCEKGELLGTYGDRAVKLQYCDHATFVAFSADDPPKRIQTLQFYIRNGKAWAVSCGTRIYQRTE